MEAFKPHLYLQGKRPYFNLSFVIAIKEGYRLKRISGIKSEYINPNDPTQGRQNVIEVYIDRSNLDVTSIIEKRIVLKPKDEVKVVVRTFIPGRPPATGASSAHYADPIKLIGKKRG